MVFHLGQIGFTVVSAFFALGSVSAGQSPVSGEQIPPFSYARTFSTYYLYQGVVDYGTMGQSYCAPTSAAMAFSWLIGHGYPKLLPAGTGTVDSLHVLVKTLASSDYLGTDPVDGTTTPAMATGLVRYITQAGYQVESLGYSGWRAKEATIHGKVYGRVPLFGMISDQLANPRTVVLLNMGYYIKGSTPGTYRRMVGHWVTVVGYGTTGDGRTDPSVLLIHNPGIAVPKTFPSKSNLVARLNLDLARLTPVDGVVQNSSGRAICSMSGMYAIDGSAIFPVKGANLAIVDGILSVTLAPRL